MNTEIILIIILAVVSVLVLRLLGAWMLRIDEVIKNQKEMIKHLNSINNKTEGEDIQRM